MISIFSKPQKRPDNTEDFRGQEDHSANRSGSNSSFGQTHYEPQTIAPPPRPSPTIRPAPHQTSNSGVTLISKGLVFNGEIKGNGSVRIEGTFSGTLDVDDEVIIGEDGRVEGNIKSKVVSVLGHLKGNIIAVDKINIDTSGSIIGDIVAPRVVMAEGAVYKGKIDMDAKTMNARASEPPKHHEGDAGPLIPSATQGPTANPPGPPPSKNK